MKGLLITLVLVLVLATSAVAQIPGVAFLKLTEPQQASVKVLAGARDLTLAASQAEATTLNAELDILLDATTPDLARIGTVMRRLRVLATQDNQTSVQFRRDVWQLLTSTQRDLVLARLGF